MGTNKIGWRGVARAAAFCACAAVLASCSSGPVTPAPVVMGGPAEMGGPPPLAARAPIRPPSRREAHAITVRPGQSLGGIAHSYHVSEHAIVAANHLRPPYRLETGMRLVIPGGGAPVAEAPIAERVPLAPAGDRLPVRRSREVIPLDGPAPKVSAAPVPVSPAAASVAAEIAREGGRNPSPAPRVESRAAERPEAEARPALHGGRFAWPVQGRVVAGYGAGSGGAHNDGINIAAARGTPIKAVEGGVVAYAGNELRGYGNLVLIKHPDGLISAYAHCDELLVKKGETIHPGQVVGRVGATGGVAEPQLHFELRRGKRPVDPREFLSPGPSAGGAEGGRG